MSARRWTGGHAGARRPKRWRCVVGSCVALGDDVIGAIVVETLETNPPDAMHWSTRSLAAKHGISRQTVAEIWQAFGLKPWRQDEYKGHFGIQWV